MQLNSERGCLDSEVGSWFYTGFFMKFSKGVGAGGKNKVIKETIS